MKLARSISDVRQHVAEAKARGQRVGLVPTMGALHEGHASLIRAARRETGFVVVSIFVNPTQFGPNEDLNRYPRTLDADAELCKREGTDLVFVPDTAEVYPPGFCTIVEVQGLQDVLCGASRPGHFRGVATVVLKLFEMVLPDLAYFGQKDAQQALIIRRMAADLNLLVEIRTCPIIREPDGLAMSSRNRYLLPEQRRSAVVLYRALQLAESMTAAGETDTKVIRSAMGNLISSAPGAAIDYVEIVDPSSLLSVSQINGESLAAVAVRFGATRLIDNTILRTTCLQRRGKS